MKIFQWVGFLSEIRFDIVSLVMLQYLFKNSTGLIGRHVRGRVEFNKTLVHIMDIDNNFNNDIDIMLSSAIVSRPQLPQLVRKVILGRKMTFRNPCEGPKPWLITNFMQHVTDLFYENLEETVLMPCHLLEISGDTKRHHASVWLDVTLQCARCCMGRIGTPLCVS